MFRISGAAALIPSAALAGLLYSRVQATDLATKSWGYEDGALLLRNPSEEPSGWLRLEDIDPAVAEIPRGADVEVRIRKLLLPEWLGGDDDDFEAMRLSSGGRAYVYGRSIAMFHTILMLGALSPLVLWSLVSGGILALRRPRR